MEITVFKAIDRVDEWCTYTVNRRIRITYTVNQQEIFDEGFSHGIRAIRIMRNAKEHIVCESADLN